MTHHSQNSVLVGFHVIGVFQRILSDLVVLMAFGHACDCIAYGARSRIQETDSPAFLGHLAWLRVVKPFLPSTPLEGLDGVPCLSKCFSRWCNTKTSRMSYSAKRIVVSLHCYSWRDIYCRIYSALGTGLASEILCYYPKNGRIL